MKSIFYNNLKIEMARNRWRRAFSASSRKYY